MRCYKCRKWQEPRRSCFYASGTIGWFGLVLIHIFGCPVDKENPW